MKETEANDSCAFTDETLETMNVTRDEIHEAMLELGADPDPPIQHEHFLALWCEWDCGQEGMLFESEETGKAWLWNSLVSQYHSETKMMEHLELKSVDHLFDGEGLAGFTIATLIRD